MPAPLVVDCSVVAKWVLPEPGRRAALHLRDEYRAGRVNLIAPDILLAECASLLSKRARRGLISPEQAHEALRMLTLGAPTLFPVSPRLPMALHLSTEWALSFWDCCYIALGLDRDCTIVTADHRLFRSGKPRHPRLTLLG